MTEAIVNDRNGAREVTLSRRTQKSPGGCERITLLDREHHRAAGSVRNRAPGLVAGNTSEALSPAGTRRSHCEWCYFEAPSMKLAMLVLSLARSSSRRYIM
jgi:hypothetical protein